MQIVLFDTEITRQKLYPFSLTRPVCDIRHGLFTLREWIALATGFPVYSLTASPVQRESLPAAENHYLCLDAAVIPGVDLLSQLVLLEPGQALEDKNGLIGYVSSTVPEYGRLPLFFGLSKQTEPVARINHPMDWVKTNASKLRADFELLRPNKQVMDAVSGNLIFGNGQVIMEEGAKATGAIFNTEDGPVYLGKNALVMEGACIKGPAAVCEGAVVKMGAQIYQGTTIGRFAVAGGEIKNSIIDDFSNKAHHGYLGDSMVGRWCNLGAGTTNSNVKNNGSEVFMWENRQKQMVSVGKKAGLLMGDFSKTAINTGLNTGTTIGVCSSIHKPGFHEKHIPSLTWGPGEPYLLNKAMADIANWFQFKNRLPDEGLPEILENIFLAQKSS